MWTTARDCLILGQLKGIRHVLNPDILTGNEDSDHVEAVGELRGAVPVDPDPSTSAQFTTLAMMHRLDRLTESIAATGLHLHERDLIATPHHQIDIAMSAAKPMRDECPPFAEQPTCGDPLAQQSECLSLFRHGRTVQRDHRCRVTRKTHAYSSQLTRWRTAYGRTARIAAGSSLIIPCTPRRQRRCA